MARPAVLFCGDLNSDANDGTSGTLVKLQQDCAAFLLMLLVHQ